MHMPGVSSLSTVRWPLSAALAAARTPTRRQMARCLSPLARRRLLGAGLDLARRLAQPWSPLGASLARPARPLPPVLLLAVTGACNLHCRQCFVQPAQEGAGLPFARLDGLLAEAEAGGTVLVGLTGGEPLTRPDLLDLVERHPRLYFQLFSNGHLLDRAAAARLGRAGNVAVLVGLDGPDALTDGRRGRQASSRAAAALDHLVAAGVPAGASIMVTRHNLERVTDERWLSELAARGCLLVVFVAYKPAGRGAAPDMLLDGEQLRRLGRREREIGRQHPLIVLSDHWSGRGCLFNTGRGLYVGPQGELGICPAAPFSNVLAGHHPLAQALGGASFLHQVYRAHRQGAACLLRHDPGRLAALVEAEGACSPGNREALRLLHHRASLAAAGQAPAAVQEARGWAPRMPSAVNE